MNRVYGSLDRSTSSALGLSACELVLVLGGAVVTGVVLGILAALFTALLAFVGLKLARRYEHNRADYLSLLWRRRLRLRTTRLLDADTAWRPFEISRGLGRSGGGGRR